jgi:hypothetical protein
MPAISTTVHETFEETTTESISVGPEVEVCRVTVVRRSKDGRTTTAVSEHVRHAQKLTGEHPGEFVVVEPELLEKLRLGGWFSDDSEDSLHASYKLISKKPFARVLSDEPYAVVRLKSYDHTVFDLEGKPLSVGLRFDYINGRVADKNFDLKGLLKHLEGRADVQLHTERYGDGFFWQVPGYNRDNGYQYLSFTWSPDHEVYREFRKRVEASTHWDAKYQVAHEMMGNEPFRKPDLPYL